MIDTIAINSGIYMRLNLVAQQHWAVNSMFVIAVANIISDTIVVEIEIVRLVNALRHTDGWNIVWQRYCRLSIFIVSLLSQIR